MTNHGILLDTNVISKLTAKSGPPDTFIDFISAAVVPLYISAVVHFEVLAGLHDINAIKTAKLYCEFLKKMSIDILPVTAEIADMAAVERGKGKQIGEHRKMADLLIGATAVRNDLTIATANPKDFKFWPTKILDVRV